MTTVAPTHALARSQLRAFPWPESTIPLVGTAVAPSPLVWRSCTLVTMPPTTTTSAPHVLVGVVAYDAGV